MLQKAILGDLNSNPWIRTARLLVMAGVAAGITAIISALPNTDWPGDYDVLIISTLTALLGGLDKALRGGG